MPGYFSFGVKQQDRERKRQAVRNIDSGTGRQKHTETEMEILSNLIFDCRGDDRKKLPHAHSRKE